jgi:hypothetical protein
LLQGIKAVLHLRMPEQESILMPRVQQVDDPELLRRLLDTASAGDIEELNRLLP